MDLSKAFNNKVHYILLKSYFSMGYDGQSLTGFLASIQGVSNI